MGFGHVISVCVCVCAGAAGPARDISLLRPDSHGFSNKSLDVVSWHPFYCLLHPTDHCLLCLHSADQVCPLNLALLLTVLFQLAMLITMSYNNLGKAVYFCSS